MDHMKWRKLIKDVDRVSVSEWTFSWNRLIRIILDKGLLNGSWLLFEGYLCNAPEDNGKPHGVMSRHDC